MAVSPASISVRGLPGTWKWNGTNLTLTVEAEKKMPTKTEVAELLAGAHRSAEPTINRIIRLLAEHEDEPQEPVKLLEVNPATSASGIFPIAFTADPPSVPYPSVVVEVTEGEYDEIDAGRLLLPHGWRLGETLFPAHG